MAYKYSNSMAYLTTDTRTIQIRGYRGQHLGHL